MGDGFHWFVSVSSAGENIELVCLLHLLSAFSQTFIQRNSYLILMCS
jgi:hypothetical protein